MTLRDRLAQFGPGLLYAGAAVGVSHLVQSTRAGAEFGLQLLAVIILVNVIKYPHLRKRTSLCRGYRQVPLRWLPAHWQLGRVGLYGNEHHYYVHYHGRDFDRNRRVVRPTHQSRR